MQPRSPLPVRGYHGTSRTAAETVLQVGFLPSTNAYDWLGTGIYFWQDAPLRAWEWAEAHFVTAPAVLEATIILSDCLDMLDIEWQAALAAAYSEFTAMLNRLGKPLPRQTERAHRLDRAVLDFFVGLLAEEGVTIRSVRAAFAEGDPVFEASAVTRRGHVQIAVRDASVIRDVRLVDSSMIPHERRF